MSEGTISAERSNAPSMNTNGIATGRTERSRRPVFVMGCHRSGTNLLYDTLLSAGGFAVYRGYMPFYKMLVPRFGNPAEVSNRKQLVETWLHSKGYRRSG